MLVSLFAVVPSLIAVAPVVTVAPPAALAAPACGFTGGPAPTELPWAIRRLDPSRVWPLTKGEGVTVAVIDSGVSATHPLLAGQVLDGRDFGWPDRNGHCDNVGHGTVIAGIIAGKQSDKVPYSGIAPQAKILPARLFNEKTPSSDENLPGRIAQAIRWAVDQNADVINLSLETVKTSALDAAVKYAHDHNVVLVAAAGNQKSGQHRDQPAYPAGYDSVIAVAGIDQEGKHVDSSVSGQYIDVAAPGVMITGPAPKGSGYVTSTEGGTSYATAYVSGVAALVRSRHPNLSADEVARRIRLTADHPPEGRNPNVGYGLVNPYRAVTSVPAFQMTTPPGALVPMPAKPDPQAVPRKVGAWAAFVGALLTLALLLGAPVVRRGRQRGWAPGGTKRPALRPASQVASASPASPGPQSPSGIPQQPTVGRSPAPPIIGRSPAPPTIGRSPAPPSVGKSPIPPSTGRGQVPPSVGTGQVAPSVGRGRVPMSRLP